MNSKFVLLTLLCLFTSVAHISAQRVMNHSYKRGFVGQVEMGILANKGNLGNYVGASSGYIVFPGFFSGIGIGVKNLKFYEPGPKSLLIPVYAQLRYSILNKTISPFIDCRAGMLMDYTHIVRVVHSESYPLHNSCGHFFKAAVGLDYKRFALSFGEDWNYLPTHGDYPVALSKYAWIIGLTYKF